MIHTIATDRRASPGLPMSDMVKVYGAGAPADAIILDIQRQTDDGSTDRQTAIVMTPAEALRLAHAIIREATR